MEQARRITPVILSGGAGQRLWPLSTPARPKQFLSLAGPESMLQMTARRVADNSLFASPVIVANQSHVADIESQLEAVGCAPSAIVVEPLSRNTAPAIALAANLAGSDDLLLVLPSDHLIADEGAFLKAVAQAKVAAGQGWLVAFGVRPDRPETGYGYIRRDEAVGANCYRIAAFVEKPDAATAARYCADGGYDWNAGMFLFRAGRFLDELEAHAPDVARAAATAAAATARTDRLARPGAEALEACPSISIDHAVMERSQRTAVVPVDMGWSDIGSWDTLYALSEKDADGNVVSGKVAADGARNCLIRSEKLPIVACGVADLIIVATDEGLLVLPRGESARLPAALERLKAGKSAD